MTANVAHDRNDIEYAPTDTGAMPGTGQILAHLPGHLPADRTAPRRGVSRRQSPGGEAAAYS